MKTVQEIQQAYGLECAKLGDMVYKYEQLGEQIDKAKLTLHNINVEAVKLDQKMRADAEANGNIAHPVADVPVAPV